MHLELWQPLKEALLPWLRSQTVQIWIVAEISAMLWLPISKDDLDDEQRLWKLSTTTVSAHAGYHTSALSSYTVPAHAGHHTSVQFLHQLCSSSLLLGLSPSAPSMELNSRLISCFPTWHSLFMTEWIRGERACMHAHTHTSVPVTLHHYFLWCLSPSCVQFASLLLSSIQHFKERRSFASFSFTANNYNIYYLQHSRC